MTRAFTRPADYIDILKAEKKHKKSDVEIKHPQKGEYADITEEKLYELLDFRGSLAIIPSEYRGRIVEEPERTMFLRREMVRFLRESLGNTKCVTGNLYHVPKQVCESEENQSEFREKFKRELEELVKNGKL